MLRRMASSFTTGFRPSTIASPRRRSHRVCFSSEAWCSSPDSYAGRDTGLFASKALFSVCSFDCAGCSCWRRWRCSLFYRPVKRKLKYLEKGDALFRQGRYAEAVLQFRNAVQIDPRLAQAHYELGRTYLRLGDGELAYREFLATAELEPKNIEAHLQLASLLVAGGHSQEARETVEHVLALEPRNARAHRILGTAYAAGHDLPHAIDEYRRAIDLDPAEVGAYADLGNADLATGKLVEAEEVFRKATGVDPKSSPAHIALGRFYFSQHKMAEAEAEMWAAAKLDPRSPVPRLQIEELYLEEHRPADAERICAELKSIAPEDPQAYRALGLFYESTGQREKAVGEFRSLLASKPKDGWVKERLIGDLIDLNRLNDAALLNREILKANPQDASALLAEGRILNGQHKYADSRTAFERAVESDPNSARAHYLLGLTQRSLGLTELAKASLSEA